MDPTSETTTGAVASGIGKTLAISLITSLAAGGIAGFGVVYGPELMGVKPAVQEEAADSGEASSMVKPPDGSSVKVPAADKIADGFRMGTLAPTTPIQSIRLTLEVGGEDAEWKEPLDMHLGTGFPFRLYPVGGQARDPSFAAFPTSTSLLTGVTSVSPGSSASFEFVADEKTKGLDVLRTTPHLLRDLKVGDLQEIGLACQGHSAWKVGGYRVEVNGQLYAEHGGLDLDVQKEVGQHRTQLGMLLPPFQALQQQLKSLEAAVKTGLATDADKIELEKVKAEIAKTEGPVDAMMGKVAGYAPWFSESDPAFTPAPLPGTPVKALQVTLATGGGEEPGTRNPVYLKAGGRKYLLASSADPLADAPKPQKFEITAADLEAQPLSQDDLKTLGIGVVGNDERSGTAPDRARLQRVVVQADGQTVYDSELKASDRKTLGAVWLVPPAHLDASGNVVENKATPTEVYVWTPGMKPPVEIANIQPVPPPPPPPVIDTKKGKGKTGTSTGQKGTKKGKAPPILTGRGAGSLAGTSTPYNPYNPNNSRFSQQVRRSGFPYSNYQQPVSTLGSLASLATAVLNALRPVPTPQVPTLSNIRINPTTPIVTDGAGPAGSGYAVQWTTSGNISPISRFEVTLFGVLPHLGTPLLAPAVSTTVSVPASSRAATIPSIQLSNLTSITPLQRLQLSVRPQVTAVLTNGTRVTQLGSLIPVFPAGTNPANVGLFRGPFAVPPQDTPLLPGTSGFQRLNSAGATFVSDSNSVWSGHSRWLPMSSTDTNQRGIAWSALGELDSLAGLRFATHELPGAILTPAAVHNTGFRPAQDPPGPPTPVPADEGVMIQFDGPVTYNPATDRGFRLIGHVVFLGTRAVSSAAVNARIRVGLGPVAQDLDGNFVPGSIIPFFSLAQTPINYTKNTSGSNALTTALLIDLPYRPDRFASANTAATAGTYLRDIPNVATPAQPTAFPNMLLGNPQNLTWGGVNWPGPPIPANAPFPPNDVVAGGPPYNGPYPPAFALYAPPLPTAGPPPTTVWVTANIWVNLQTTDATGTDAIGVMGLRIVPDNTP